MIYTIQEQHLQKKRNQRAAVTALFYSALTILILFLFHVKEYDPPRFEKPPVVVEIEMEVLAGGSQGGSNSKSEMIPATNNEPENQVKPQTNPPNQINTQPQPSDAIPTSNQQSNSNTQHTQTVNQNALYRPSGGNGDTGEGTGTGNGNGNESGTGNGQGNGPGDGYYEMAGRNLLKGPDINAQTQEVGYIALNIFVDQNGNVVNVTYNREKSDIQNAALIEQCKKSAKTMKFDANPNAKVEQKGIYYFKFEKV